MTTGMALRRINCTQCSAPLELHGGHKVERIVCSYCGSLLDNGEGYKVLERHYVEKGKRSFMPLQPGDEGTLKGVSFTVIGFITYRVELESWTEFCLFSPTHGYAWLSWENGHYVFMRRLRNLPAPSSSWWSFQPRQKIAQGATRFKFYEAYSAEITDIGGELPWHGKLGDRVNAADAVAPPRILSQEIEGQEIEYHAGEYLPPQEVAEAFDKPDIGERGLPRSVHPAQPYVVSPLDLYLQFSGRLFGVLAFLGLLFTLVFGSGDVLLQERFSWQVVKAGDKRVTRSFEVTQPGRLVEVSLGSSVNNAWLWLDLDVTRKGEEVFSLGKEISFYEGYDGGEHWSEGSQGATALFRVPKAGVYELNIKASEWGGRRYKSSIDVVIAQGILLNRWFLILTVLLVPFALWALARRMIFEYRRWAPVTQDEDDD
ncbi:MAG: DUF4178 domain-containing protein [Gammaproteobacteria bacterium]|nr:DUF4178 domain-containing protein [Gammaproteobacteria bacterium]